MAKNETRRVRRSDLVRLQERLQGVEAAKPADKTAWAKANREAEKTVAAKRAARESKKGKKSASDK